MSKTPEEIARDEFSEQIKKMLAAHGDDEGFLVDWVLITAQHQVDNEGSSTALGVYVNTEQPMHRTMGLIAYGQRKLDLRVKGLTE